MIKWFRKNKQEEAPVTEQTDLNKTAELQAEEAITEQVDEQLETSAEIEKSAPASTQEKPSTGFFSRIRQGLSKTRHQLGDSLSRLLLGKKEIDAGLFEELETILLSADLGMDTCQAVLDKLTEKLKRNQLNNGEAVLSTLKEELAAILADEQQPLALKTPDGGPFVLLMVGVNGAGKTTTIGKLAYQYKAQGKKVMLAAGDTFRAAAVEQLKAWGERNDIPVIAQQTGADSASVIYDALQAAKARDIDVLIADTAGRLHTQSNLMEELKKIKRVMGKLDPNAPHETMLVLDGSIGQNALNQARHFNDAVNVTGISMTKLDGSAKGGILFAIANELKIPFRYIGVGEGIEDLRPFDAAQFISAIFNDDHIQSSQ